MRLNIGTIQPTKNTAIVVADALRSAILQGRLRSGQSLKQDEIAAEFNVSKIPVREALVQLQAEGLVNLIPRRGAVVSKLSYDDIAEIYTIRIALEPIALRQAIPQMTHVDFVQLDAILEHIDHEEDLTKWAELNWEFHSTLYAPANMPRLIQMIRTLHHNVARYLKLNYLDKGYLAQSQQQHTELLRLSREGQVDQACELLVYHLSDPLEAFKEAFK
jgi:DNA-binding GntR family transcriptional regulator